jgi:hypothetical protein
MGIKYERISVTVAGSAGSAAGSATSRPITGEVLEVHVAFTTQPATVDTTIATAGSTHPAMPLLTLTNVNTSAWYLPRKALHNDVGAAVTYNGTQAVVEPAVIADAVTVSVAQGDPGSVAVTIVYEG